MYKFKKYVFSILFGINLLFLQSCSEAPHVAHYSYSLGYEYDLPSTDWHDSNSKQRLDLTGPEGNIAVEFILVNSASQDVLLNSEIENVLTSVSAVNNYQISKITYQETPIMLARLTNDKDYPDDVPIYAGTLSFGDEYIIVARGYPKANYEEPFREIFLEFLTSLEPYQPEP